MKHTEIGKVLSAALLMALIISLPTPVPAFADDIPAADDGVIYIEYGNLRELLMEGSQDLKDSTDTYYTNLENYQDMIAVLSEEQDNMKFRAEQYKDNDAARDSYNNYRQNASVLGSAISRLERQVASSTSTSGFLSTEKTIDSYEMSAQALMNSYNQMLASYNTQEKATEAAQELYNTAVLRLQSGSGTQAELEEAQNSLLAAKNQLESYRIQVQSLKESLLTMLGIDTNASVVIGTIPDPDIEAILSIDLSEDMEKAVGNNSQVQSARHTNAYTETERNTKERNETIAEGNVRTDLTDSYEQLMATYLQYQSACEAYTAAQMEYDALQRRRQAGLLTDSEYLNGEVSWLQAQATKQTATMNLSHAYDSYEWEVKGVG